MKTALITGASGGIGTATTKLFLENGYKAIVQYRAHKPELPKECELLKINFSGPIPLPVIDEHIDVFINCVGVYQATVENILNINLVLPMVFTHHFAKKMSKEGGGSIVNISSIGVKYCGNSNTAYTISKAALEAMTRSMAKEYAPYGVRINCIRAGIVNTGFKEHTRERIDMVPMKRMADPKEIAEAIFFLASDKASYITGSIMTVAGGE